MIQLDGEKTWISNGVAGHYVVLARTGKAARARGISVFSVPASGGVKLAMLGVFRTTVRAAALGFARRALDATLAPLVRGADGRD